MTEIKKREETEGDRDLLAVEVREEVEQLLKLALLDQELPAKGAAQMKQALGYLQKGIDRSQGLASGDPYVWEVLLSTLFTGKLGKMVDDEDYAERSCEWLDEWMLGRIITKTLDGSGVEADLAQRSVNLIRVLIMNQGWLKSGEEPEELSRSLLESWLKDEAGRQCLRIHVHNDVLWFNKEAFEELVWWTFTRETILLRTAAQAKPEEFWKDFLLSFESVQALLEAEQASEYQVEMLLLPKPAG